VGAVAKALWRTRIRFRFGRFGFGSRLILGTGKYKDVAETRAALEASGAEVITVALRRIDLKDRARAR